MNRTSIEWVINPDGVTQGFTWNPVVGCKRGCPWCYARRIARRFGKTEAERNFEPMFHRDRLMEPYDRKKPSTIFVGSMADVMGPWSWQGTQYSYNADKLPAIIKNAILWAPQHTFLLLTKYPERYRQFNPWPPNVWLGATATNGTTMWAGCHHLSRAEGMGGTFISLEPLLGDIDCMFKPDAPPPPGWLIVGAQSGVKVAKDLDLWFTAAFHWAYSRNVPIFFKDSARKVNLAWYDCHLPYLAPQP